MRNTLDFEHVLTPAGVLSDCRLRVDANGMVQSLETGTDGSVYDGFFAVPGMPNAHSHAFQRALTGYGEAKLGSDSFWSWRDAMYRLANRVMPDDLIAISSRAYADMLLAGFTSVGEFHYLHHWPDGKPTFAMAEAVLEAAQSCGMRLVMLPVFYQQGGFDQAPLPEQRRFVHRHLDDYVHLLQRLKRVPTGIAPHSIRAVEPGQLRELVQAASQVLDNDFPIHIHIAEQTAEVNECISTYGRTPIWLLADSVNLDPRWNFVHATHAEDAELQLMVQSGVNAVLCLLTEAYLGDGIFPARKYLTMGGGFAIGSDSNTRIDAISELRWLEYGQRLTNQGRSQLGNKKGVGEFLWSTAAAGGARSLKQPVGEISVGHYADLVVLDQHCPALSGASPEQLLDAWLVGGDKSAIQSVYVGGVKRVDNGELIDAPRHMHKFPSVVKKLMDACNYT